MLSMAPRWVVVACFNVVLLGATGCQVMTTKNLSLTNSAIDGETIANRTLALDENGNPIPQDDIHAPNLPPGELNKVSLPRYRIEPPDVLLIQAIRSGPKSPYYIETFDILQVVVAGTPPDAPIAGTFQVEPDGTVNLGPQYGHIEVGGKTVREAEEAIFNRLQSRLDLPEVAVSVLQTAAQQLIAGEHLVAPDGYINLGKYGSVYVAGMTLDEAKSAIETKLGEQLEDPIVSVDVFTYNSKVYYVIIEGAGFGNQMIRLPITGNETVLDALSLIGGTQRITNTNKLWIARPAPQGSNCTQILPVGLCSDHANRVHGDQLSDTAGRPYLLG